MYKFASEPQTMQADNYIMPLPVLQACGLEQGRSVVCEVQADASGQLYVEAMPSCSLQVAASCLVQPLAGDRVHGVVDGRSLVITAILARRESESVMTLNSRCTTLRIVAAEIEIQSARRLTLQCPQFLLFSRSSRWVADTLQQVSKRLFVRTQTASRKVEQTDEVHAKHILQDARQSFVMKSEIASLKSSAVLKIDGGQVHVG